MIRLSIALISLLILPSCFLGEKAVNEPLDHRVVQRIQPGTSAANVVKRMGAPDEIVQLGRRSAYRYSHRVDKGTGLWLLLFAFYNEDTRADRVWFFFDEKDTLTHVGSTFRSHRASFGMSPSYDEETNRAADAERGIK